MSTGTATSSKFDTSQFNKTGIREGDRGGLPQMNPEEVLAYKRGMDWLQSEVPTLEAFIYAWTGKHVKVRSGPFPCTDGDTIYLRPPKIYDGELEPSKKVMAHLWHEIAHVVLSQVYEPEHMHDAEHAIKVIADTHIGAPAGFMWNALEDGRVEDRLYVTAPGARKHIVKEVIEKTPDIVANCAKIGEQFGQEHLILTADQDLIADVMRRAREAMEALNIDPSTSPEDIFFEEEKTLHTFQHEMQEIAERTGDKDGAERISKNIAADMGILMSTYLETAGYHEQARSFETRVVEALEDAIIQNAISRARAYERSLPVMVDSTKTCMVRLKELGFFQDWDPRALGEGGQAKEIDWNDLTDEEKEAIREQIRQQKDSPKLTRPQDMTLIKNAPKDLFKDAPKPSQESQPQQGQSQQGEPQDGESEQGEPQQGQPQQGGGQSSSQQNGGQQNEQNGSSADNERSDNDSDSSAAGPEAIDGSGSAGDNDASDSDVQDSESERRGEDERLDGRGAESGDSDEEDALKGTDAASEADQPDGEAEDLARDVEAPNLDYKAPSEELKEELSARGKEESDEPGDSEADSGKVDSTSESEEEAQSSWTDADEQAARDLHSKNEALRVKRSKRFSKRFGDVEDSIRPPHVEYVTKEEAAKLIPNDQTAKEIQTAQQMEVGEISGAPEHRFLFKQRKMEVINPSSAANIDKYNDVLAGEVNRLRAVFKNNMKSSFHGQYEIGTHINGRSLPGFILGEHMKPFDKRVKPKKISYAVTLLIDQSGSMRGDKILTARTALAMQASLLDKLNIPFEVLGFSTLATDQYFSGRWDYTYMVQHDVFKSFNDPWTPVECAKVMSIHTNDSNLDGLALSWAWDRLRRRNETVKILMTYSDGQPAPDTENQIKVMRYVLGKMINAGAVAIGIGIQSHAPEALYPKAIYCNDLRTLPRMVTQLLEQELKRK